jgi:hypothetical protein
VTEDRISFFRETGGSEDIIKNAAKDFDYRVMDQQIKNNVKKMGYDSIIFRKTSGAETKEIVDLPEVMVIDNSAIKTRSQLRAEWDKVKAPEKK